MVLSLLSFSFFKTPRMSLVNMLPNSEHPRVKQSDSNLSGETDAIYSIRK